MAGGVPQAQRLTELNAELPTAGSLLNSDPTDPESNSGLAGSNKLSSGSIRFGDADLMAPSNAGLYTGTGTGSSTPAPAGAGTGTGAELADRAKRSRDRRVSRKRKQR